MGLFLYNYVPYYSILHILYISSLQLHMFI